MPRRVSRLHGGRAGRNSVTCRIELPRGVYWHNCAALALKTKFRCLENRCKNKHLARRILCGWPVCFNTCRRLQLVMPAVGSATRCGVMYPAQVLSGCFTTDISARHELQRLCGHELQRLCVCEAMRCTNNCGRHRCDGHLIPIMKKKRTVRSLSW